MAVAVVGWAGGDLGDGGGRLGDLGGGGEGLLGGGGLGLGGGGDLGDGGGGLGDSWTWTIPARIGHSWG